MGFSIHSILKHQKYLSRLLKQTLVQSYADQKGRVGIGVRQPFNFVSQKSFQLLLGVAAISLMQQTSALAATGTFRDEFTGQTYSENDGSQNWSGSWTETGDDGLPGFGGNIFTVNGFLFLSNQTPPTFPNISRQADLTGATQAYFTFNHTYSTGATLDGNDQVAIEVSQNGTNNWITLDTISGPVIGSKSYDISNYIGPNTSIRFRVAQGFASGDGYFAADNVEITAITTSPNDDFSNACNSTESIDVLFILDDSGSIDASELVEQRLAVLDTLDYFISNNINATAGIARFSTTSSTVIDYTPVTSATRPMFETALANNYGGAGSGQLTNWEAAFQAGVALGVANPDVTFFFTDGTQNNGNSPIDEAEAFRFEGVHIYGIGIGADVDLDDFRDVTDGPNTLEFDGTNIDEADYVSVTNYSELRDEFGNFVSTVCAGSSLSGRVFEDVNYGGGDGRPFSTPNTVGINGATVELYDASGNFVDSTITQSIAGQDGAFSFTTGQDSGTYQIRVVNSTLTSSRSLNSGYTDADTLAVQTFRNDPDEATPGITNEVGGTDPDAIDSAANTTNANLSTLTAQSVTNVTFSANTPNIDFGFNFDTIVNTNDSGQGSLRQFLNNSNALANNGLDQDDTQIQSIDAGATLAAGDEHSIFMIPTSDSGYIASPPDGGTGNTFVIQPSSNLPAIADNNTALDGRLQTAFTGDSNAAVVEVSTGPEVVVDMGGFGSSLGIQIDTADNILIHSIGSLNPQQNNTAASGLYVNSSENTDILNSTFVNAARYGITLRGDSQFITIEDNVSRNNGQTDTTNDGLEIADSSSNVTVRNNQFINNNGFGIDLNHSGTPVPRDVLIENNLVKGNGAAGSAQAGGIGIRDTTGNVTIRQNEIQSNLGAGVVVRGGENASGVTITQNSIFDNNNSTQGAPNDGIGIDLTAGTQQLLGDGVTANDNGDSDAGGNDLLNFPVFESARIQNDTLIVMGFAPAGATIELFIADDGPNPSPLPSGYTTDFGEGKTYLTTVTEGSGGGVQDTDGTTGSYTDDGTGATTSKTQNRFEFAIPLTGASGSYSLNGEAIASGTRLTATATVSSSTSEFSGVHSVLGTPEFLLVKRVTQVGATSITSVVDGAGTDDDNPQWPANYLQGSIDDQSAQPGEEIEYTIYFLSSGTVGLRNVNICDLIPTNTTYVTGSGKIAFGTTESGWTDPRDAADGGEYIAPDTAVLNASVPGIGLCRSDQDTTQNLDVAGNPNGLVWVEIDKNRAAIAAGEEGYIRFKVRVNKTPDS